MSKPHHHQHIRKRIYQHLEEYPHPDSRKRLIDQLVLVAGVLGPAMTIPQLIEIWIGRNASGVSALTWSAYLVMSVIWLTYGIIYKEKPIIVTYVCWIIFEGLVVLGVLLYR